MTYFNNLGQGRIGWRSPGGGVTPSTLWNSIYGVWNADALGTSLDTSIRAAYNGDNVNDSSGNAVNGTNVNNVTFTTGKVGNALTFNGSNNYVNLGNDKFSFAGNFTISAWVNLNTVSGNQAIMSNLSYVSNISNGWLLLMRNNKLYFEFYKNNGTYDYLATNTNLTTSTWYHIIVVRVASQSTKIYINGVLDTSNSSTYNPTYTSTIPIPASIGAWKYDATNATQFTNGKIDALNVWDKALTDNEILSLYNEGNGTQYPFTSQTLPSLNDSVGTNHGTRPSSTLTGGALGPSFTAGKIGQAFNFDGINDIVALADNSLNLTSDFSISMWANWGRNNTSQILMSNFTINPNTRGWFIEHAAGQLRFRGFNSTGGNAFYIQYGYTPPLNTWVHYTFVHKNNDNQMYINGVQVLGDTSSSTHAAYESTNWPMIGANRYNPTTYQEFFQGKLDGVSVWNKALTQADVTDLYNSGTGKQYPN